MDRLFQGFTDGCLMAQNVLNAVKSMDLGGVFVGSIHNNPRKMIEIIELPELTLPIIALAFGIKDQAPQLKPKMDMKLRVFEDSYKVFDNYLETFSD